MMAKRMIAGTKGNYIGKFKGSKLYHRIPARSSLEARAKMLKGTRYTYADVTIKKAPKPTKSAARKNSIKKRMKLNYPKGFPYR